MEKNMISNILPKDGEVFFYKNFFSKEISDSYYSELKNEIKWKQEPIILFGKEIMQPRLTSWYGDKNYTYSGITLTPYPWTEGLLDIKNQIEKVSLVVFNSALLNQYRDGQDSMGWHRDNEKSLGENPIIGSVSFGATRSFQLQHIKDKHLKVSLDLSHGSFLLMKKNTQHLWKHRIPKTSFDIGPRINITFRVVNDHP